MFCPTIALYAVHRARNALRGASLAVALGAAIVAGCGGGGGGGGDPDRGGTTVFTADFQPVSTGDRRLYRVTAGSDAGVLRSETIGPSTTVGGQAAWELRDETGDVSYLIPTSSGLSLAVGPGDGDLNLGSLGPIEALRYGVTAGESVDLADRSARLDLDGDGRLDTVTLRTRFSVLGFEAVNTALARFADAAHVRTEVTVTFALAVGRTLISVVNTDEWYARGIGRVRSVSTARLGSDPAITETEEIVAYGVGSRRSDTVAPTIVSPLDGAATPSLSRLEVRLSEPVDPLSLGGANGLALLDGRSGTPIAISMTMSADGTLLSLTSTTKFAEGPYVLRVGADVVDWANNPLGPRDWRVTIDRTGPRLVASDPAQGSGDFALDGTVVLTFSEPLTTLPGGTGAVIEVLDATGLTVLQTLPATVSGATITARVAAPLVRNTAYRVRAGGSLTDLAGNALQSTASEVSFRTNQGAFARPVPLVEGTSVTARAMADLDGDGRTDLVFAAGGGSGPFVGMRPGLPGGGFGPARSLFGLLDALTFVCDAYALTVGDFDGDGRRDVALPCGSFLRVYLQTAPNVFTMERPGFNGVQALTAIDVNGDGRDDLVVQGTPPGTDVGGLNAWQVFTRSGPGNWTALAQIPHGGDYAGPFAALVRDIDGDGRPDLVWVQQTFGGRAALAWARATAAGFGATQTTSLPDGTWFDASIAIGDLDGDGHPDVVFGGTDYAGSSPSILQVLRGLPGGGFGAPQTLPAGRLPGALAIADADGDGRADILVVRNNGSGSTVGVLLQQAGGGFDAERGFEISAPPSLPYRDMTLVDVNGDGLRDLIVGPDLLLGRQFTGTAWPADMRPSGKQAMTAPRAGGRTSAPGHASRTALGRGTAAVWRP